MSSTVARNEKTVVNLTEGDILRFSSIGTLTYRCDPSYFTGRAGAIRVICLFFASLAVSLMTWGYDPVKLTGYDEDSHKLIMMMKSDTFSGYGISKWTFSSLVVGGCSVAISLIFILLLLFFLEVRCELVWEKINQRAHVLACILSVAAAFCDIMSIQEIQDFNCDTIRCREEQYNTRSLKSEEVYYPPFFVYHYISFVIFLINAMLFSIASRIWLRNEDS